MFKKTLSSIRSVLHHKNELKRFRDQDASQRNIVFYSETAAYWAYLGPFVEQLTAMGRKVSYVTSDDNDPVLISSPDGVEAFAIGDGTVRTIFFATLEVNLMVMSLLDLETFNVKKSKAARVHYVFVPHNMVSTHMVFRKGSHDHFDTIFCVGPHHVAELREAEKLYGIEKRNLVENGYVRLDSIYQQALAYPRLKQEQGLHVLIAPSWGPQGLLESGAEELVANLLDAKFSVCVRPHWETVGKAADSLKSLQQTFGDNPAFSLISEGSTNQLLFDADLLISDWSGAAFSFAFGVERPVLFVDTPKKINNPDYKDLSNTPVEITLRDQLGVVLPMGEYKDVGVIINELCRDPDIYADKIRLLRMQYNYNLGDSAAKGAQTLAELADSWRA